MKVFIESLLPSILYLSQRLDKISLLVDEPWVVNNYETIQTKFIFKKDGFLLVSENGSVNLGKWELLNKANSILLEYKGSVKLLNHAFMDEAILILKFDGTNDFFTLINHNKIPDLNLEKYLKDKYVKPSNKTYVETNKKPFKTYKQKFYTSKGTILIEYLSNMNGPSVGDFVTLGSKSAPNGKYNISFFVNIHVSDGVIEKISMF